MSLVPRRHSKVVSIPRNPGLSRPDCVLSAANRTEAKTSSWCLLTPGDARCATCPNNDAFTQHPSSSINATQSCRVIHTILPRSSGTLHSRSVTMSRLFIRSTSYMTWARRLPVRSFFFLIFHNTQLQLLGIVDVGFILPVFQPTLSDG